MAPGPTIVPGFARRKACEKPDQADEGLRLVKHLLGRAVIVGTRTRRCSGGSADQRSSHSTPASPRDSVSAMTCAWVTGTKSCAPR